MLELQEFCKGISLPQEAADIINEIDSTASEETYVSLKTLFQKDKEAFYTAVLKSERAHRYFLYYYCKMACETWEMYQAQRISEKIFWDTFSDFAIWCRTCLRQCGEYGLREYGWLFRHIEMTIFKLGRLQFEQMPSEWEFVWRGRTVSKGEPVISVHIPEGEPLNPEKCREAFRKSFAFWGTKLPYVCHSWLLGPQLRELLAPTSNILQFQQFFEVQAVDYIYREGESRIFLDLQDDPILYPEQTSLQRRAKAFLVDGGKLGNGLGILKEM